MRRCTGKRSGLVATLLIGVLAGVFAAPAAGQGGEGAAFDQYIENVPGSRGEKPTHEVIQQDGDPLASAPAEALRQLGPLGERTARVSEILTRKDGDASGKGRRGDPEGGLGATLDELLGFDGDGLGFILPLILVGTLIAGLAFALSRRLDKGEVALR